MKLYGKTISTQAALILLSSAAGLAAIPSTTTTLSFSPAATVEQGSAATATISVTSGGVAVTSGSVSLFQAKSFGAPGPCSAQNGSAEVQSAVFIGSLVAGQVTIDMQASGLTSTVGTIGYIAQFSSPGDYHDSSSACLDFTVNPDPPGPDICPSGQNAVISATFATSPGFPLAGTSNTWNLLMNVHACKDLTNVTAQGGSNAWTTTSYAPLGAVSTRKGTGGQNNIIIWTIGNMTAGQNANLNVTVSGSIKPNTACGTVLGLLGAWSATSTSADFGTQKSVYTGTSTVTVGPNPCQ